MLLRLKIVTGGKKKNISISDQIVLFEKLSDIFFSLFQLVKVKDRIRIFERTSQKHVTTYQNSDFDDVYENEWGCFCRTETPEGRRVFVKYHKWKPD